MLCLCASTSILYRRVAWHAALDYIYILLLCPVRSWSLSMHVPDRTRRCSLILRPLSACLAFRFAPPPRELVSGWNSECRAECVRVDRTSPARSAPIESELVPNGPARAGCSWWQESSGGRCCVTKIVDEYSVRLECSMLVYSLFMDFGASDSYSEFLIRWRAHHLQYNCSSTTIFILC